MDTPVVSRSPAVTVLLPVYNAEKYIGLAIESILAQTFSDFELLIINDGSTDTTLKIVRSYKDPRIRVVSRPNKGLMKTLNEGVRLAQGKYIARQDADDLSAPERFALQVARLDADDSLGMIGSNYIIIDEAGKHVGETQVFTHHDDLAVAEPVSNQFGHGSIMVRSKLIRRLKGYDETVGYVEDYDLWSRLAQVSRIANTKESLYFWRRNYDGISMSNAELQQTQAFAVRDKYFGDILKHPQKYRLLSSWHPFSFNAGIRAYHQKKSLLQRDLAYLYLKNGRSVRARRSLFMAALYSPWQKRTVKEFILSLTNKDMKEVLTYEYL